MFKYIITVILICIILYLLKGRNVDDFGNVMSRLDSVPHFVHLYDNNGTMLNVVLISKPFSSANEFKKYLININKYIFIGITSYMEFPHVPTNPIDNYEDEKIQQNAETNPYYLDMYYVICQGWLHCFREPIKYLPSDKPHALISESDFINYKTNVPDPSVVKIYDFIYSCPKVNKDSTCDDWVSYNKNWELALKCLPILCEKYKLKGLLVGRDNCDIPEKSKQYITTTGWVDNETMRTLYQQARFQFVPNKRDASPRVITEGMCFGLPCLMNYNILGGWKYIDEAKTGVFFTDENDIADAIAKLIVKMPTYDTRQYIIDNYGPINSGKKLKEFLFSNFKNKLNITDCEYVTIRHPIIDY